MLRKREGKKKRPFGLEGELKQESHLAIVRKPQVRASGGVVQRNREKHLRALVLENVNAKCKKNLAF